MARCRCIISTRGQAYHPPRWPLGIRIMDYTPVVDSRSVLLIGIHELESGGPLEIRSDMAVGAYGHAESMRRYAVGEVGAR